MVFTVIDWSPALNGPSGPQNLPDEFSGTEEEDLALGVCFFCSQKHQTLVILLAFELREHGKWIRYAFFMYIHMAAVGIQCIFEVIIFVYSCVYYTSPQKYRYLKSTLSI